MDYKKFNFEVGKKFDQKEPSSVEEYLEAAEAAHKYLDTLKVETEDGVYWADPDSNLKDGSLYTGASGISYFYLELYKVTGDKKYAKLVRKAADYQHVHWKSTEEIILSMLKAYGINMETGMELGYLNGDIGVAEFLLHVYNEFHNQQDLDTVREIANYVLSKRRPGTKGPLWGRDCSIAYDSGVMIVLYHISNYLDNEKYLQAANDTADRIISQAIHDPRGGLAWTSTLHDYQGVDRVPNFEGGTAGVGFALGLAYQYTQNPKYLVAAKGAADHIRAIGIKQGDGYLVPWHDKKDEEPIFYVANCHGPAGTSKLFYQLYKVTGDDFYLEDIRKLYRGLRHIHAPEEMSPGCWNSVCVCCGAAGEMHFFINCALLFKDEQLGTDAAKSAETCGHILLGEQEAKAGGREGVWPIAYDRVLPEQVAPAFGYYTGSAGIAAGLLQLYLFDKGVFHWDRLIDDPYPGKSVE